MTLTRDAAYPIECALPDFPVVLSHMGSRDIEGLLRFADQLSEHDLLFLRRDIRQLEVLEDWLMDIDSGDVLTILAKHEGEIVGESSVHRDSSGWSAHVAELRVVVSEVARGKGLGKLLTREAMKLAERSSIEKMMARMTVDQKGAIAVFGNLGFHREALMRDHVKDLQGKSHDLVVMSCKVGDSSESLGTP